MTRLTIQIDENISLRGTIVSDDDDGFDLVYQPECPFEGNCEYAGNIMLPMFRSNIHHGNVMAVGNAAPLFPPIQVPPGQMRPIGKNNLGWFDTQKNVYLHGNLMVQGDITTVGQVLGVGSTAVIQRLPEAPASPNWTGITGELATDNAYMYLCVDTDTWVRWPISSSW